MNFVEFILKLIFHSNERPVFDEMNTGEIRFKWVNNNNIYSVWNLSTSETFFDFTDALEINRATMLSIYRSIAMILWFSAFSVANFQIFWKGWKQFK